MSWISFQAVICEISWFFYVFYINYFPLSTANSTINLISLKNIFQLLNFQSYFLALMTVSLVSIRIPLPAASARYLRSVFFELEVVYSPSILVARILLVIFLNRNMYFTVLSLDLGLMFFFFPGRKRRGRDIRTKWKGWW